MSRLESSCKLQTVCDRLLLIWDSEVTKCMIKGCATLEWTTQNNTPSQYESRDLPPLCIQTFSASLPRSAFSLSCRFLSRSRFPTHDLLSCSRSTHLLSIQLICPSVHANFSTPSFPTNPSMSPMAESGTDFSSVTRYIPVGSSATVIASET